MGRDIPCSLGRGGIVAAKDKREGDGATPAGSHRIVGMLYRPDRLVRPATWALPIRPSDVWSDDPTDPDYNLMARAPHGFRHERLYRADPLYDLILITDWNWPYAVKGRGSAIFVHCWRGPRYPTAGCVGFDRHDLIWIAARIRHQTRLIVRH
ncbi:MAG: L,D-transpeptidase family protein [Gemmobacter sp.]|nr:L,D-transpeptidase family protein [Gemmobacter sp.]